jgi:hypothetical protein
LQSLIDKINTLLLKLFKAIKNGISKLIPQKLKDLDKNLKNKIQESKKELIKRLIDFKDKSIVFSKKLLKDLKSMKRSVSRNFRQLNSFVENFSIKKIDFKKILLSLLAFLNVPFKKITSFLSSIPTEKYIIGFVSLITLSTFTLISYNSINEIYKNKTGEDLIKFSTPEEKKEPDFIERPVYFKREKKQFTIRDINLPIYVESINAIRMLTLDFTIEGNNRYIAAYFKTGRNEDLIKNQLVKGVEPIIPTFPLNEEGKRILKNKLTQEMNVLIKSLDIKGKISKVYIDNILAN